MGAQKNSSWREDVTSRKGGGGSLKGGGGSIVRWLSGLVGGGFLAEPSRIVGGGAAGRGCRPDSKTKINGTDVGLARSGAKKKEGKSFGEILPKKSFPKTDRMTL